MPEPLNIAMLLEQINDLWSPRVIADFDGFHFKLAKLKGDFVWHSHADSSEAFYVLSGQLRIDFRDGSKTLQAGEMLVVPPGVEHKPYSEQECHVLLFNRAGTINTGNAQTNSLTADPNARL